MPINCRSTLVEKVLIFFEDVIDGSGKHQGHPRNQGIPNSIKTFKRWIFCDLDEAEFNHLVIPDGTQTLIKDKTDLEGFTKRNVEERLKQLRSGKDLEPLIVTELLPGEGPGNASYYIKDGAKRAIAYKVYFETISYRPVKSYIGYLK